MPDSPRADSEKTMNLRAQQAATTALAALLILPSAGPGAATPSSGETFSPVASATARRAHHGHQAAKRSTKPTVQPARKTTAQRAAVCRDPLVATLRDAGFRGRDLREAWAIVMRESRGRARVISTTHDYGLFQFNRATFSGQKWWHESRLLTAAYNARVAYRLSQGGRTWLLWGLTGRGEANPKVYRAAGWAPAKVQSHIVSPYQEWFKQYPC